MSDRGQQSLGLTSEPWHALEVPAVEDRLGTGSRGLTEAEAAARLSVHGFNQLEEEPPASPLVVFFRQFRSPLIFILVVAMAVTLPLGTRSIT